MMKKRNPNPCPECRCEDVMVEEKRHESVILIGDLYQCKIKCTACGEMVSRISDESAEHARRAAVEAWNREGV